MPIESATYVQDLDEANPTGTDERRFGDDHIRLIKEVLKNTFPDATGPLAPPAVPSRVLLATQSGAAASYVFTNMGVATPQYKSFEFNIEGLIPVTNAVDLYIQLSTNNGSTWLSAGYNHARFGFQSGGGGVSGSSAGPTSQIIMASNCSNDVANVHHLDAFIRVYIGAPSPTVIHWSASYIANGSLTTLLHGYGKAGIGINAIRFIYSASNIAAGTIRCYGLA